MASVEKDERFYMTLLTFQVESCLFRVPRQPFESKSKIFRDMFSLPVAKDISEGLSDENPIHLEGIKKEEFKRFLEVLFMGVPGASEETTKSCVFDMWFPVVKLARLWEFDDIHQYAVKNMPYDRICKTPAEKVGLAHQYGINPWLLPGVNELAKREEPLGNHDLELLGQELALKVAAVRESLTTSRNGLTAGTRDARGVDFTPVIKRVFRISDYGNLEIAYTPKLRYID